MPPVIQKRRRRYAAGALHKNFSGNAMIPNNPTFCRVPRRSSTDLDWQSVTGADHLCLSVKSVVDSVGLGALYSVPPWPILF
jgi:hypothetical protein